MEKDSVVALPLRNKRGISVMIGYILLITFAVAIAAIVYQWLNSYVPQEDLDCPDGASIYVSNVEKSNKNINLTLQNNGRFSISGIFIRYTNNSEQDVATNDLSENITSATREYSKTNPGITFQNKKENALSPEDSVKMNFNRSTINNIDSIQITPKRSQEENNKPRTVICTNAQTEKAI